MDFEEIYKELKKSLVALAKEKFLDFKDEGKKDMEAFLESSKDKLQKWTKLLASKDLTLEDYHWLVKNQKDLLVMNALYQTGISRIKLGHFKNKVIKTIIETIKVVVL